MRIGVCVVAFALLLSFGSTQRPADAVKEQFVADIALFAKAIVSTHNAVNQGESVARIHAEYRNLRDILKRVEPIVMYTDPEFATHYFNGAPLPRLAQTDNKPDVVEPMGMQVIDELIADPIANADELKTQLRTLLLQIQQYKVIAAGLHISDRIVVEAVRYDVLRLFTLGVTGFDTPGTAQAIEDARVTLDLYEQYLAPYLKMYRTSVANGAALTSAIEAGRDMCSDGEFDTFDRLAFYTDVIRPLYAQLLTLHNALRIEKYAETTRIPRAVNYEAESMFDEDFLNAYYFVQQHAADNDALLLELGEKLFHDTRLSSNNLMSCATCHQPEKAFTDGKVTSTIASDFNQTPRNAMTLFNSVYARTFFYDLRAKSLELQFEHVIFNPDEFNTNWDDIVAYLHNDNSYSEMFTKAFEGQQEQILPANIKTALAHYVMNLKSSNSRFDVVMRGEGGELTDSERRGFNLFMGKAACATCHFPPTFAGLRPPFFNETESEVLGVTESADFEHPVLDADPGRIAGAIREGHAIYQSSFKTVTVRNIDVTGPYMHNGAYEDLETVMDFYRRGGGGGLGLDVPNQTLPFDSLDITDRDVNDIIAFMKTLTDSAALQGEY